MAHDHAARQVHDLPEPRPLVVTEHRAHVCQCAGCGARITAFAIYLTHQQMLPQKRLVALMADLFGVRIAAATIEGMSRACAARLKGFSETVRGLVGYARRNFLVPIPVRGRSRQLSLPISTMSKFALSAWQPERRPF